MCILYNYCGTVAQQLHIHTLSFGFNENLFLYIFFSLMRMYSQIEMTGMQMEFQIVLSFDKSIPRDTGEGTYLRACKN